MTIELSHEFSNLIIVNDRIDVNDRRATSDMGRMARPDKGHLMSLLKFQRGTLSVLSVSFRCIALNVRMLGASILDALLTSSAEVAETKGK